MFASGAGQSFWLSVFVDPMLAATGLSRTMFSALYAIGTVVSAAAMTVVGRLADRYGLRVVWLAVSVGLAAACLLTSAAEGAIVVLLGLALLRTFGQGSFPLVATLLVASSFDRGRSRALSVSGLGLTTAGVVLPPLGFLLIASFGWRAALQIVGLVLVLGLAPLARLVKVRRPAGRRDATAAGGSTGPSPWRANPRSRGLPTRQATLMLGILAVPPLVITAAVFHATSLLAARGLSAGVAATVLALLAAAGAAGTLAGGFTDRLSVATVLGALSAVVALAVALLLVPLEATAVAGYAALGVAGGLYAVTNSSVWARIYGSDGLGRIQGLAASTQIAAAALGPLPLAASLGLTASYGPGLMAAGGLATAAVLASLSVNPERDSRFGHR